MGVKPNKDVKILEFLSEQARIFFQYKTMKRITSLRVVVERSIERDLFKFSDSEVQKAYGDYAVVLKLGPSVLEMKKNDQLSVLFRECLVVKYWFITGAKVRDGYQPFDRDVLEMGLRSYKNLVPINGIIHETPLKLHTYECMNCHKVYGVYLKKLPDKLDVSKQYSKRTPCCSAPFYYAGIKEYDYQGQLLVKPLLLSGGVAANV